MHNPTFFFDFFFKLFQKYCLTLSKFLLGWLEYLDFYKFNNHIKISKILHFILYNIITFPLIQSNKWINAEKVNKNIFFVFALNIFHYLYRFCKSVCKAAPETESVIDSLWLRLHNVIWWNCVQQKPLRWTEDNDSQGW